MSKPKSRLMTVALFSSVLALLSLELSLDSTVPNAVNFRGGMLQMLPEVNSGIDHHIRYWIGGWGCDFVFTELQRDRLGFVSVVCVVCVGCVCVSECCEWCMYIECICVVCLV